MNQPRQHRQGLRLALRLSAGRKALALALLTAVGWTAVACTAPTPADPDPSVLGPTDPSGPGATASGSSPAAAGTQSTPGEPAAGTQGGVGAGGEPATAATAPGAVDAPGPADSIDRCSIVIPTTSHAEPRSSPVTWTLTSLDVPGVMGPGTATLAFPHRFRLVFSGAVNWESVTEALHRRLEPCAFVVETRRLGADTLDVTLQLNPQAAARRLLNSGFRLQGLFSVAGATDAAGRPLADTWETPQLILEAAASSDIWALDPQQQSFSPTPLVDLSQPYDVLSMSPDGRQFLLRLPYQPSLGGGPPVGPPPGLAFVYDVRRGQAEPLADLQGWIFHQWLSDGALLAWGGGSDGSLVSQVIYRSPTGEWQRVFSAPRVVAVFPDPTGRRAAVFSRETGHGSALVDLTILELPTGRQQHYEGAARPQVSPNGVPEMVAAFSPDGSLLAYWDTTGSNPEGGDHPRTVWLLNLNTGERTRLTDQAFWTVGPWSPDGTLLAVGGVGLMDRQGEVVKPLDPSQFRVAWAPDGTAVFIQGEGIVNPETWGIQVPYPAGVAANWSPTGGHLVVAGGHRSGLVTRSGEWLSDFAGLQTLWSRDGRWAYTENPRGDGVVLDLEYGAELTVPVWPMRPGLQAVGGRPRPLAFSPEGRLILAPHTGW